MGSKVPRAPDGYNEQSLLPLFGRTPLKTKTNNSALDGIGFTVIFEDVTSHDDDKYLYLFYILYPCIGTQEKKRPNPGRSDPERSELYDVTNHPNTGRYCRNPAKTSTNFGC